MDNTSLEMKLKSLDLKHNPIFTKKDHIKYVQDWRGQYKGDAAAILKPINTIEVSDIMKFANEIKLVWCLRVETQVFVEQQHQIIVVRQLWFHLKK